MVRYNRWWKKFCKNCKYHLCPYSGITCDNCPNSTTDSRSCNCQTESEENEKGCPYFVDSIKDLINSLTISQRKFCKETGIDRTTIYNIMHDVHTPSNLTIKRICTYFGVDYRNYLRSRKSPNYENISRAVAVIPPQK